MTKGDDTRAAILVAATDLVSKDGLAGLRIGGLAKNLGLSKSGLFGHFGSKDALLMAVTEAASERFVRVVIRPAFKRAAGRPRLEALFENWLDWSESREFSGGCPIMAATLELDDQPGPLRDYLQNQQQTWLNTIAQAAQIAIANGHLRSDLNCSQFAFEFNSFGFGYHFANRFLRDGDARQKARTALANLLSNASFLERMPKENVDNNGQ